MLRTVGQFGLIEAGDRLLVAISGGKDSYTMLDLLWAARRKSPVAYEIVAVHLDQKQPGYDGEPLRRWLETFGAPFEILDVLAEAGADIGRVIMGHLARTIFDDDKLLELAAMGSYLEYDLWGWETSFYALGDIDIPTDAQRIAWVKLLIDEGYAERIVLAHDVFSKTRLVAYGGFGMGHILENIVPRMRQKGISKVDIDKMLVQNPARLLAFA